MGNTYNSFADMFKEMRSLTFNEKYKTVSEKEKISAFSSALDRYGYMINPYTRNTRIKNISSRPISFDRETVERQMRTPMESERSLREESNSLSYASYPYFKLLKSYADMLTYRWFYHPKYLSADKETERFKRERILVDRLCKKLNPSLTCRIIAQRALREGKVAYIKRVKLDKAHNRVQYAALQELPSDYTKIVGRNDTSFWSVAFDFSYFWQEGTSIDDFPPYFKQYYDMLRDATDMSSQGKKILRFSKANEYMRNHSEINVEKCNSRYMFWVTLPPRECWVFGADFSTPIQAPTFMGLFLTLQDLTSYEYLQQQLTQVPLYAFLTGEMETFDEKSSIGQKTDVTKISPDGRSYYVWLFHQMTEASGTQGLDIYPAPLKNMQLHQLNEIPNANDTSTAAYQQFFTKSGISGLLSTSDKPTASMVNAAQKIESKYIDIIYSEFSACMKTIFEDMNLDNEWDFYMFGTAYNEKELVERYKYDISMGQSYMQYFKLAVNGLTIQDAIDMSLSIKNSGLYDLFENVESAFNATGEKNPAKNSENNAKDKKKGRPRLDIDDVANEYTEKTIDRRED